MWFFSHIEIWSHCIFSVKYVSIHVCCFSLLWSFFFCLQFCFALPLLPSPSCMVGIVLSVLLVFSWKDTPSSFLSCFQIISWLCVRSAENCGEAQPTEPAPAFHLSPRWVVLEPTPSLSLAHWSPVLALHLIPVNISEDISVYIVFLFCFCTEKYLILNFFFPSTNS